jgi:short-subunit dehydrogenase
MNIVQYSAVMPTAARPRTLITGASAGIGAAFAARLAAQGHDLLLVARSADKLTTMAAELAARHGIAADAVPADLGTSEGVAGLVSALQQRGLEVGMLINNAGFGTHGRFAGLDPEREAQELMLNVYAPMMLTRALLPAMIARGSGDIINVASTAAFQPVPFAATYGATKAFLLSFSEALAEETRAQGIRVLALCPGATKTAFFDNPDSMSPVGRQRSSEQVVATALRALERGKSVVIDGLANTLLAQSVRIAPRRFIAAMSARLMKGDA